MDKFLDQLRYVLGTASGFYILAAGVWLGGRYVPFLVFTPLATLVASGLVFFRKREYGRAADFARRQVSARQDWRDG